MLESPNHHLLACDFNQKHFLLLSLAVYCCQKKIGNCNDLIAKLGYILNSIYVSGFVLEHNR